VNAPYDEPGPEQRSEAEHGWSLTAGEPKPWLRRAHHPLPRAPSAEAFGAIAARAEREGSPWIGWDEGQTRYLAGGSLASWSFPPQRAFARASQVGSEIRERVVVEPEAAPALLQLPLLWHGFAFRAGPWNPAGAASQARPLGTWPGSELRLPAWLLYARGDQAGLVVHSWVNSGEEPGLVQDRLNERLRDLLGAELPPGSGRGPAELRLLAHEGEALEFQRRVAALSEAMRRQPEPAKVVLSRRAEFESEASFDAAATWRALAEQPGVRAFAWSRGSAGQLVGASPELLLALRGDRVESEALAGTAPLADAEWLERDPKNAREHALVAEAVTRVLRRHCGAVTQGQTSLRRLRDLVHLQTPLSAVRRPEHDLLELAAALHPTPALGGTPRAFALPWLAREERGWFGAPLGYSDQAGGGELLVTIRSALLRGKRAELFAGAGILPESDPLSEWRETELKLEAAAGALRTQPPAGGSQ
jgi:isochorismate synthase